MKNYKQSQLIKAIHYIYENIDQPTLTLENISDAVGISTASLKRSFQQALDQSLGTFIRRLRMELAFKSLQGRNESVLEVALSSGFEDQSAFTRRFKAVFGYAPTQARNKLNLVHEFDSVTLEEPDIVEFPGCQIQCVTEQGRYFECAHLGLGKNCVLNSPLASWHVQNGTSLHELQQLGGWSNYDMVLRYSL